MKLNLRSKYKNLKPTGIKITKIDTLKIKLKFFLPYQE